MPAILNHKKIRLGWQEGPGKVKIWHIWVILMGQYERKDAGKSCPLKERNGGRRKGHIFLYLESRLFDDLQVCIVMSVTIHELC